MGLIVFDHPIALSLLSGLVGSIVGGVIGAYSAYRFYRCDRYDGARLVLIARLRLLYDDSFFSREVFNIKRWEASVKTMTRSYYAVVYFASRTRRRRIRLAWENYIGQDRDTEEEAMRDGTYLHTKVPPMTKEQFEKRIQDFLDVLK